MSERSFGGTPRARTAGRARRRATRNGAIIGSVAVGAMALVGAFTPAQASVGDPVVGVASSLAGGGWSVTAAGVVTSFGGAPLYGSPAGQHLNDHIVGITATTDGGGYYLVASDGGIFSYGDARFFGSTGNLRLNEPIVGMAVTPNSGGYWLVAADGGIFSYGDAGFFGSTGSLHLAKPIVGMTSTADGQGYELVASDGGIFSFGDAQFHGSMGGQRLNAPIVGMASDTATSGYWMVASDGGVFSFDAPFEGSATGQSIAGMISTGGSGYEEVSTSGVVSSFGSAATASAGQTGATVSPTPVAPVAPVAEPTGPLLPAAMFDRPVTAQPVNATATATEVSSLVTQYQKYYGAVGVNGLPVYTVGAAAPTTIVTAKSGCSNAFVSDIGTVPIPSYATTTSSDDPMVVYQPSTHTDWELWQATETNGAWSACWGGKLNTITSDGVFAGGFGLSASGISYLATTITEADIESGVIDHTISMDVVNCNYHTAPAARGDCGSDAGAPQEGTWFRMPANVAMPSGMTPYAQMVFRALQTYGAVVMDQAGAVMIQGEKTTDWAATGQTAANPVTASWSGKPEYSALNGIPWADLQVIVPPSS